MKTPRQAAEGSRMEPTRVHQLCRAAPMRFSLS